MSEFDVENLYGIYELVGINSFVDGQKTMDSAKAGMFVFTREGRLSVVSGANAWVMAYTGDFVLKGDILFIEVKSCVVRELEGSVIERLVLKLDGSQLVLASKSSAQEKYSEISWVKTHKL